MGNCNGDDTSIKIKLSDNSQKSLVYGDRPIIEIYTPYGYAKYQNVTKLNSPVVDNTVVDFMQMDFEGVYPDKDYTVILDIYVNPDKRHSGYGRHLIEEILTQTDDNPVIVAVGASMKEYPTEPSDDDKVRIAEELSNGFYASCGFDDINEYIGGYEFKRAMIYARDVFESLPNRANSGCDILYDLRTRYTNS